MLLSGFINPVLNKPAFIIPVFNDKGSYYVQVANVEDSVDTFSLIHEDIDVNMIIPFKGPQTNITQGSPILYAFMLPDNKVLYGSRKQLANKLKSKLNVLTKWQFVYLDILEFTERYDKALKYLENFENDPNLKCWIDYYRKHLRDMIKKKSKKNIKEIFRKSRSSSGYVIVDSNHSTSLKDMLERIGSNNLQPMRRVYLNSLLSARQLGTHKIRTELVEKFVGQLENRLMRRNIPTIDVYIRYNGKDQYEKVRVTNYMNMVPRKETACNLNDKNKSRKGIAVKNVSLNDLANDIENIADIKMCNSKEKINIQKTYIELGKRRQGHCTGRSYKNRKHKGNPKENQKTTN